MLKKVIMPYASSVQATKANLVWNPLPRTPYGNYQVVSHDIKFGKFATDGWDI